METTAYTHIPTDWKTLRMKHKREKKSKGHTKHVLE